MIAGGIAGRGGPASTTADPEQQIAAALKRAGLSGVNIDKFTPEQLAERGILTGSYDVMLGADGVGFRDLQAAVGGDGRMVAVGANDTAEGLLLAADAGASAHGRSFNLRWFALEGGGSPVTFISEAGSSQRYLMDYGRIDGLGLTASFGRYEVSGATIAQAHVGRDAVRAAQRAELYAGYQAELAVSRAIGNEFSNQVVMATGQFMLENATPYGTYLALRDGDYLGAALGLLPMTRAASRLLPNNASRALFSSNELAGVERASDDLLDAVGSRRAVTWATEGSDAERFLNMRGAEAASFGADDILLRPNPSKAAVLEEFLHGTQERLGIVARLGTRGLGSAETHVKNFMIRHQQMLGLSAEDVRRLETLRDMGL